MPYVDPLKADFLVLTVKIVSTYIGNNGIAPDVLPALIQSVFRALATADQVEAKPEVQVRPFRSRDWCSPTSLADLGTA